MFEVVGCAGFLEIIQHNTDSRQQTGRHYTVFIYYFLLLFNKTIRMYFILFVFYYKIIGLSFKKISGPRYMFGVCICACACVRGACECVPGCLRVCVDMR